MVGVGAATEREVASHSQVIQKFSKNLVMIKVGVLYLHSSRLYISTPISVEFSLVRKDSTCRCTLNYVR